jgi:hypothetical protein
MCAQKSVLWFLGFVVGGGCIHVFLPQEIPPQKIRVEVDMVSLPVVVMTRDGKYRRIEVKMNRSGLYVQTRQGYCAPYGDPKKK